MLAHHTPLGQIAGSDGFGPWAFRAAERGHVHRGYFHGNGMTLHLAYPAGADLDGEFAATCLDTGDHLTVQGWLYESEDVPTEPANRASLHPVLHAALAAGDCSPHVAALIRDWGERDPIDAMQDARLLAQAFKASDAATVTLPDVSRVARRAYRDFMRHYGEAERIGNAEKLATVLTEWADAVLQEAIAGHG